MPKALLNTESIDIQISNNVDEEPIIIDLTSSQKSNEEEALITGEETDQQPQQPQLITFGSAQPVSNLRPVKITDEVISFTAQQDLPSNIKFETFEIRPVEPLPTSEAPIQEEVVTPIVANQELRSFFAQNEIQSDNTEVIDLPGDFNLINEDKDLFVTPSIELDVTILEETTDSTSSATPKTSLVTTTTTSLATTQTTTVPTTFKPTETESDQTTSTETPQVEFINRILWITKMGLIVRYILHSFCPFLLMVNIKSFATVNSLVRQINMNPMHSLTFIYKSLY